MHLYAFPSGGDKETRQDGKTQRPLPQEVVDHGARFTLVQRIQALTLLAEGCLLEQVFAKTGIPARSAYRLKKKAHERGFRPEEDPRILEAYVEDGKKSGRPKKVTETVEEKPALEMRVLVNSGYV